MRPYRNGPNNRPRMGLTLAFPGRPFCGLRDGLRNSHRILIRITFMIFKQSSRGGYHDVRCKIAKRRILLLNEIL